MPRRTSNRVLQHQPMQTQHGLGATDVRDEARIDTPWMTTAQACEYLQFTGVDRLNSLYRFIKAKGVPVSRRSRMRLLIHRAHLDAALATDGAVRRRNALRSA